MSRFGQERMFLLDVATENAHGANANAKRKERLAKSRKHDLANPCFLELCKVRQQVELEAFACTRERERADHQDEHNDKERRHHRLRDAFHTALESKRHNRKPSKSRHNHPEREQGTIPEHFAKLSPDFCRRHLHEVTHRHHAVKVIEHPPRHRRVKHHQEVVTGNHRDTRIMPLLPRLFKNGKRTAHATLSRAANSKFHHENWETKNQEEKEVNQHKGGTAILSRDKRETPNVAKPNSATCRNQNET